LGLSMKDICVCLTHGLVPLAYIDSFSLIQSKLYFHKNCQKQLFKKSLLDISEIFATLMNLCFLFFLFFQYFTFFPFNLLMYVCLKFHSFPLSYHTNCWKPKQLPQSDGFDTKRSNPTSRVHASSFFIVSFFFPFKLLFYLSLTGHMKK